MHMSKRLIFGAMLCIVPLAAWAFVKPLRVLAPQLEGLTCDELVCVDDNSRRVEATRLYRDALESVQSSLGALHAFPRGVFCATTACSNKFGCQDSARLRRRHLRGRNQPSWLASIFGPP